MLETARRSRSGRTLNRHSEFKRSSTIAATKRGLDVVGSLALGIAAAPLIIAAAIAVKATSAGAPFYGQTRCGRDGRPFVCYKLRTMVNNADDILKHNESLRREFMRDWKLQSDPRVTRIGAFLRKTSPDELPQLWNVLRGDMSLVGPRPVQPEEIERFYGECAPAILSVRPGITGLWQVSGRSQISYQERVAIDLKYVREQSLPGDMRILAGTIPAVLRRRGAV